MGCQGLSVSLASMIEWQPGTVTYDRTVGESLSESARDKDDVGKDDTPLPAVLFGKGQLETGTEEGTGLEEGDHVGTLGSQLGLGEVLGNSETEFLSERREGEGTSEETGVV